MLELYPNSSLIDILSNSAFPNHLAFSNIFFLTKSTLLSPTVSTPTQLAEVYGSILFLTLVGIIHINVDKIPKPIIVNNMSLIAFLFSLLLNKIKV